MELLIAVVLLFLAGLIEGEQDYYTNVQGKRDDWSWQESSGLWYDSFPEVLWLMCRFVHSMFSGPYHGWQAVQGALLGAIIGVMSLGYDVEPWVKACLFFSGVAFGAGINVWLHVFRGVEP